MKCSWTRGRASHPQVLVAIARTLRMLRGASTLSGECPDVIAALDRELTLTVACCAPDMLPADRARVEEAAAL